MTHKKAVSNSISAKPRLGPDELRRRFADTSITMLLLVYCIYFIIPIVWMVIAATKTPDALTQNPLGLSGEFRLFENIQHIFNIGSGQYLKWLQNSALYTILITSLATLLAATAGYALAVYPFPGSSWIVGITVIAMLVPSTATALPLFYAFSAFGAAVPKLAILNTPLAFILPASLNPFGVYLIYLYFKKQFPHELLEAARLDGAGHVTTFLRIALPSMAGLLATVAILTFVASWNNFFLPWLMVSNQNLQPVPIGLATWAASQSSLVVGGSTGGDQYITLADLITGGAVAVIPVALVFTMLRRYWVRGFLDGGIKG
jgi:multiple sugar transport system permease protein